MVICLPGAKIEVITERETLWFRAMLDMFSTRRNK